MVNVKRIFDALMWLECNTPLYNHIILPDIHDELCLEKLLNTPEFEIQKKMIINLFRIITNWIQTLKETRNNIEVVSNNEQQC